ncbi:MAG: NTP pyrophosphohydrolase [Bacteroidetes bacterium 4572_117]|nr:MAG: NTP pyrophosphohydrolase [Bacteroidetes bacterium 4572_117]
MKSQSEEMLPIVDEDGKQIGKAPRSLCHKDKKLLHPVVHVHFFNEKGDLFLQKRSKNKLIQAGKWDTSVGGHVADGETLEQAVDKEVREEIGITEAEYQLMIQYIWESEIERELVYVFFAETKQEISINKDELEDGKFWPFKKIKEQMGKNVFTPNFEKEFGEDISPFIRQEV